MSTERHLRSVTDVERAIDELYGTSPDEFTAARNAAAKRLTANGDAAGASRIKALHRPTQVAYVLNQLTRRHPDDVAALVDVGRELARAQRKALRGGDASDQLREAIAHQREAIRALTTKTGALMRDLGVSTTGHLDEVAGALQAALVDPAVGAQLEEGRLEKVPAPAAGFPGTMPVTPTPASAEPRAKDRERQRHAAAEAERRARDARLKHEGMLTEARVHAQRAQERADALSAAAAEVRRTASEVRADARRLAEQARRLVAEAKRVSAAARARSHEATRAEAKAKEAEADAKKAQHEADRLATKARER